MSCTSRYLNNEECPKTITTRDGKQSFWLKENLTRKPPSPDCHCSSLPTWFQMHARHTSNASTKETGVRTGMGNRDWAWESSNIAARYKILYISTCSIFVTKSTDFSKEFTQFLKCPNKRFWLKKNEIAPKKGENWDLCVPDTQCTLVARWRYFCWLVSLYKQRNPYALPATPWHIP